MSKITNRDTTPQDGGPVEHRLARLLDGPFLARVVPHLPPETLHQLIRYRGLDACGELVTSATPAQLTLVLDLDLWRHARPGRDEQFDVDRFGEWLEVLVDTGDSVAARTVAALDKNLVVAGLSRYVRVFDPASSNQPPRVMTSRRIVTRRCVKEIRWMSTRRGTPSRCMPTTRRCTSRAATGSSVKWAATSSVRDRADAWDAIVTLLVALDAEHSNDFHAVMQGCRRLSNSRPEIDGLDDLLLAPEQHLRDVTIERERRRSQQGYATPGDARAFLQMARQPNHSRSGASVTGSIEVNPIVTAYFREADEAPESSNETARIPERTLESSTVERITTDRRAGRGNRGPRIDRSGHRTVDRSRRDAGAPARASRSRGWRPAGSQAHALAAADGVRARHRRNRLLLAQS